MLDTIYTSFKSCLRFSDSFNHNFHPKTTLPLFASATQDHEQDQAQILANLAKMHDCTPRPELRPFPYLFPPPPTAPPITQAVVNPSLVPVIFILRITAPEITGTRNYRTLSRPSTSGHTSLMTGGVRIGTNAEEEKELTSCSRWW